MTKKPAAIGFLHAVSVIILKGLHRLCLQTSEGQPFTVSEGTNYAARLTEETGRRRFGCLPA